MSDDKEQEWVDPVLGMLEGIRQYVEQVKGKKDKTTDETSLATCIEFMFAHMERKSFEDAPTHGPEVDEYETEEVKSERSKIYSSMVALIELGIITVPVKKE